MSIQLPPYHHYCDATFSAILETIEVASSTSGGRSNLDQWIIKNTSDPTNPNKPWSFKHHEYQLEIVNSKAPRTSIMKASQIGVSEIAVRIAMALLAKLHGRHAIYTLQDAMAARKFAPTRFDPVIEASKRLKAIVSQQLNNNQVKQLGSSYLHITGAQSEAQSISVPATILIHDELAYSKEEVIGTYSSRLGHVEEGQEIVYDFSTPLLPNHSIHKNFLSGTMDTYMVYHSACNHWVKLDPLTSVKIPGLDVPFDLLAKSDISENLDKVNRAYIECPHCKAPIAQENLVDPNRRAWVPENPGKEVRSFDSNFLVLPALRTPSKVLKDRINYRSTEKWLNFAVGRPADSTDNRLSEAAIEKAFSIDPTSPPPISFSVSGMDVGKFCHHCIGGEVNGSLYIYETNLIKQDQDNNSAKEFTERYKQHRCIQGIIDAGPEFTVVTKAQSILPYNQVWGCYFTRGRGKSVLEFYEKKEIDGVILANRTKALDEFSSDFNHGRVIFNRNEPNIHMVKAHLRSIARVTDTDPLGEDVSIWTSLGEDHFFMATFYTWLAWKVVGESYLGTGVLGAANEAHKLLFGKTRMKR